MDAFEFYIPTDKLVEATSVADYLDRYYKPRRYRGEGPAYAEALLASYEKEFEKFGCVCTSHHDNITGQCIAWCGPRPFIPVGTQFPPSLTSLVAIVDKTWRYQYPSRDEHSKFIQPCYYDPFLNEFRDSWGKVDGDVIAWRLRDKA